MTRLRVGRRRRERERGIALVMVLGAITVLTVFLTELQERTASDLSAALSERDAMRAEYMARSGVNLARLLLAIEPEIRRAIPLGGMSLPQIPVWEFSDMLLGPFNDPAGMQAFGGFINADPSTGKNLGLPGGRFELKIVDEDSKLSLNSAAQEPTTRERMVLQLVGLLAPPQYNAMFEGRDLDGQYSDRQAICAGIVDWADIDADVYPCDPRATGASAGGAEDNFYQLIGQRYRRKNAPFDSLEELRMVRGVGDDFWATFVDPQPSDPHKRIMTVWGLDKVNVNTANAQTLFSLICSDAGAMLTFCSDITQVTSFLMGVNLVRSFTAGVPLFMAPADFTAFLSGGGSMVGNVLAMLGVRPIKLADPKELERKISLQSQMFSIYSEGVVKGLRRTTRVRIHAVIDRRTSRDLASSALGGMGGVGGLGAVPGGGLPGAGLPGTSPNTASAAAIPTAGPLGGGMGTGIGLAAGLGASGSPQSLLQAVGADPAGSVVYYRIE